MNRIKVQQAISKYSMEEDLMKKFIEITMAVRDIPYGVIGSREAADVFDNNLGTCSGKHMLLKELYLGLGLKVQEWISIHHFNNLKVDLNSQLKDILSKTQIPDPHNFLKVLILGKWIQVDITWDAPLRKIGLETNEDWDGESDMRLCVYSEEEIKISDSIEFKKEYLSKVDESVQKVRKDFLNKFAEYLAKARNQE